MLIDTHCHIHEASYELPTDDVLARAEQAGVTRVICVGTSQKSSEEAVAFATTHAQAYAAIGVHPHETQGGTALLEPLVDKNSKVVAVGEIGLDYFYTHSPREVQLSALEAQIDLALRYNLPIIFHVREAFDDFWPIFRNFKGIRGELHSFTDTQANLERGLSEGLFIGVNGISTFTKQAVQQAMFDSIPLERLLFETDAPFLTPAPFRGKINEPAYVKTIAQYHAQRRGISLEEIAEATTRNARKLFTIE